MNSKCSFYSVGYRLEKRVFVSLPETEAREAMIRKHVQDRSDSAVDFTLVCMCLP
jgi:SpoVK/Ycf46/Vps4 family AAA+-type ATPase